jgi:tyrosine-protein phosphatase SIW14
VKTVVDLRRDGEHSVKAEQQAVEAAGMHYVNVPLKGIVAPTDENISKALALLQSSDAGPVFLHCRQGVDRTGTVIACYRIAHDGWRNQVALDEAKSYGMHGVEVGMKRYVLRFSPSRQAASVEPSP